MTKDIFDKSLTENVNKTFSKINRLCDLVCKYTKETYPLAIINFKCSFKDCPATYKFTLVYSILSSVTDVVFTVDQTGQILHNKVIQKQFKKNLFLKN